MRTRTQNTLLPSFRDRIIFVRQPGTKCVCVRVSGNCVFSTRAAETTNNQQTYNSINCDTTYTNTCPVHRHTHPYTQTVASDLILNVQSINQLAGLLPDAHFGPDERGRIMS